MSKRTIDCCLEEEYKREIAAHFNPFFFSIVTKPVKLLLEKTFNEITIKGIEEVKKINGKGTLVYASNHRSYTDPGLLILVLYNNNLKQPYYAAGKNMFNSLSSWFLKSVGTFSVDRANKDAAYLTILKDYIGSLVNERKDILFYIEGGRSYDGRIKTPKLGILKAVLESQNKDAFIVPTSVSYEQVLEDRILTSIAKKTAQRKFTDEAKELLHLYFNYYTEKKKRYSTKAYVTFANPISIRDYSEKRSDLKYLAERIIRDIEQSKQISSTSLVAAATLESITDNNETSISEVKKSIEKRTAKSAEVMKEGIGYFLSREALAIKGDVLSVKEPKILQYYANAAH